MLSLWWGATYDGAIWIFLTSFWASGPSALKQKNSEWSRVGPSHSATPSLSCLILSALFLFSFHLKLLIAWILFLQFKNQTQKQTTKTNHLCNQGQAVFAEWWPTGKHTIWPLEGKLYKSLTGRISLVSSKNKTTGCTDEDSLSWDLKGSPYMETSSPSRLSIDRHDPGIFCLEQCSVILNSGTSRKNSGSTQRLCALLHRGA